MLPRNKKERVKLWTGTFFSVGAYVFVFELLKMCTRA